MRAEDPALLAVLGGEDELHFRAWAAVERGEAGMTSWGYGPTSVPSFILF